MSRRRRAAELQLAELGSSGAVKFVRWQEAVQRDLAGRAAKTERLKLGVGIMNPYSVHVFEIVMMAATMQEATGGRFLLGVAAGSAEFLAWAGLERPRPLAKTAETIRVARSLLGAGDVDGKLSEWFGPLSELRFPLAERVPVYVGGMSPKMLEMAGRLADGVLPLLYPRSTSRAAVDVLGTEVLPALATGRV